MGADESCCASDEDVSAIVSLGVLEAKVIHTKAFV
jgi:hypothetical protein